MPTKGPRWTLIGLDWGMWLALNTSVARGCSHWPGPGHVAICLAQISCLGMEEAWLTKGKPHHWETKAKKMSSKKVVSLLIMMEGRTQINKSQRGWLLSWTREWIRACHQHGAGKDLCVFGALQVGWMVQERKGSVWGLKWAQEESGSTKNHASMLISWERTP